MIPATGGRDYREQTSVHPYVIRPGRASSRTTFQLVADVVVPEGQDASSVFIGAAKVAIVWFATKYPDGIPPATEELPTFELDHHGQQQLLAAWVPEDWLWSVRLVQPDTPFQDRPAVAGRTWTTELALRRTTEGIRVAVRVNCASAPFATEPIVLTRPRVVLDLAKRPGLSEVRPIDGKPWALQSIEDLQLFRDFLCAQRRSMPVVLLTQPDPQALPGRVADYLLDQEFLARRLQGYAHVVCMPRSLGYTWTGMVGKVWSAFLGAVRTYQPGLSFDSDSPFSHPRVLADKIVFWRHRDQEGEAAFTAFLIERIQADAATRAMDWGECAFYADARSRRALLSRQRVQAELTQKWDSSDVAELEDLYTEEFKALRAEIEEARKDAKEFDGLASDYRKEAERLAREKRSLQLHNDSLRLALKAKARGAEAQDAAPPSAYEDLPDWVEANFAGRLELHPRALQGIKKATFDDISLVCSALSLLADSYRDMRMGVEGAAEEWNAGLVRYGLRFGPSITRNRAGEEGDTYFVAYPPGSGKRQFLDYHLRDGSTKDDRYCLAIYFFWDEASQIVVVGWLPSHLDTRAT